MTELITFTVVGLAIGSIYSIASVGLVVTYTTSGIFNFAHGAIGMFAAFIYWQLRWDSAWGGEWPAPLALAFVLLIVSPSLGILLQTIVMKGLEGTSETTKLVIPIAVMLAFIGITNWVWQDFESRIPEPFFGRDSKWELGDAFITTHQTIVVVVAVVLAIVLKVLLTNTRIGITMRAVVDNQELVRLNGSNPQSISSSQLGNRLRISGIGGDTNIASSGKLKCARINTSGRERICCRNIWTPQKSTFDFPRRYSNRPSSIILELGIRNRPQMAVAIRATSNNSNTNILFAILIVLPQERLRGAAIKKHREVFKTPTMKSSIIWGITFVVIVSGLTPMLETKWEFSLSKGIGFSIIALSMVLLTGYAGEINLAPLAFAGIGALSAYQFDVGSTVETGAGFATLATALSLLFAFLVLSAFGFKRRKLWMLSVSIALLTLLLVTIFDGTTGTGIASRESLSISALLVATLISGITGALVALPALRLRGLYLGLATFAFAIFVDKMVYKQRQTLSLDIPFIGDGEDITFNIFNNGALNMPRPEFLSINFKNNQSAMLILLAICFTLIALLLVQLKRSSYGRQLSAMKDSPAASATLGLNMLRLKLSVFTLAAAIAGFGGALHASNLRAIQEDAPFTVFEGLGLFMLTVVGGIGYVSGALIGGILYGTAFIVMGDFWAKLATDWNSFNWLFTFLHDFFLFLGPAVAGIGLGRNPNGIAAQIFDGFRVLGKRESRRILAIMVMIIISVWVLRVSEVIDGWTFLLLSLPILLVSTLIADKKSNLAQTESRNWELLGLDAEISMKDEAFLDETLNLGFTKPQQISQVDGYE